MYRKHDGLSPRPNHVCKLSDYTCSIKQVLAMHMHNEHNGAAPLQKSCNIGPFTSHLSDVLKNHIDRKHLCIEEEKTFECNRCDFSAKSKVVLKHHKHLKHGEEASLMCKLCDYRT